MKYQELLFPLSVICILLMVKYWSSLNTITSRPWKAGESAGVNQDKGDMCSALFTVTDTPVDRMLHRYIYNLRDAASYRTNGTDWSNDDWMMGTSVVPNSQDSRALAAAIKGVREVRLKRISSTGVSTDDYQTLSRLLPQLVSYDKISKNCEENTTKGGRGEEIIGRMVEEDNQKNGCLLVRGSSILDVTKGVLPYVPCLIASYDQRHTFSTCVRKRIEKKQSLWIHFLGDSKIRNIFQAFLNRTDSEYQYMIMYLNQTKKWRELRPLIRDDDLQYEDMEATSEAEPRMRITLSFRRFMSVSRAELQSAAEMAQLRSWASGDEVPPDLLLVGYSTWLLQRSLNLDNSHALGFMLALQKEVVPLLEQISRRSLVLVLPQSRLRQHGKFAIHNTRTTYNNGNFDWIEMMFLYHLRRYRDKHNLLQAREMVQLSSASSEKAKSLPADTVQPEQPYRDYLAPQESGSGGLLWWWDTSLPLNLAEISECEEMYRRGRESDPLYQSDLLRCRDAHHAGSATQRDLVTMMFNLMCNSVLGLDHSVCCS